MSDITWREIITGPRWAGISKFVKDECWGRGLKPTLDIEKGWLTETCRIDVTGPEAAVNNLKRDIYAAIEAYRSRTAAARKEAR